MVYYTDGRTEPSMSRQSLRALATLISDAFMEHHNWKRVIENPRRRKRALYALFYFMATVINRHGHIVVRMYEGRIIGYTTFMENADKKQVTFWRVLCCGGLPWALVFISRLRPRELASMQSFNSAIDAYYGGKNIDHTGVHLYTTAIEPQLKGRGLMKASFAYAEERLKAAGFSSYMLETTDPANIAVYHRLGLGLVDTRIMPGTDRSVWFFIKAL